MWTIIANLQSKEIKFWARKFAKYFWKKKQNKNVCFLLFCLLGAICVEITDAEKVHAHNSTAGKCASLHT